MKDEITLEEIKAIIELIRQNETITQFSFRFGDVEVSLSRGGEQSGVPRPGAAPAVTAAPPPAPAAPAAPSAPPGAPAKRNGAAQPQEGEVAILAPMVGTFYRSPKPGDPPFVEVGGSVNEDTVLCIIEVMKLMNSLEAKVAGVVTRILVEDSQPVEHGQPLMFIKLGGN